MADPVAEAPSDSDMLTTIKEEINHTTPHVDDANCQSEAEPITSNSNEDHEQIGRLKNDTIKSCSNLHADGFMKTQTSSVTKNKLMELRTSVEDKSYLLTNAWTELYNLLGEYKAELFSKEIMAQKYESISDVDQLRTELLEKDNEINSKDSEIRELRDQLDQMQRHDEQCQMDLSVKDSLLKKYQEDLLQKEAALMTCNTKASRLENRLRVLEARAGAGNEDGPTPRKLFRPLVTQATSGRVAPSLIGRFAQGGVASRTAQGGIMGRLTPGSTGRPMPGIANRFNPGLSSRSVVGANRRRPLATPIQASRGPVTRPEPVVKEPIVCIEVDDDDEIRVTDAITSAATSGDLYMGVWPDQDDSVTDTTQSHSLPGSSQYSTNARNDNSLNQPLMTQDDADFTSQDESIEGAWPVQMTHNDAVASPMRQQPNQSPSSKEDLVCGECGRIFSFKSSRDRHINIVHRGIKNFVCPLCSHRFSHKANLDAHLAAHNRGNDVTCAECSLSFTRSHDLEQHIIVDHAGKNYIHESKSDG